MRAVLLSTILVVGLSAAQDPHAGPAVPLQPFAQSVRRLETALAYLGQPLPPADHDVINEAIGLDDERDAVQRIEAVLDRHALLVVRINPESRVSVEPGAAAPELVRGRHAPVPREGRQPGRRHARRSRGREPAEPGGVDSRVAQRERARAAGDAHARAGEGAVGRHLAVRRSLRCLEAACQGCRSSTGFWKSTAATPVSAPAQIAFNVGQGTQDIGFRNDVLVVFTARPAHDVLVRVARRRTGKPGDGTRSSFATRGPRLSRAREAAGARPALPAAGVPRRR